MRVAGKANGYVYAPKMLFLDFQKFSAGLAWDFVRLLV